jgi:hypothetical protein
VKRQTSKICPQSLHGISSETCLPAWANELSKGIWSRVDVAYANEIEICPQELDCRRQQLMGLFFLSARIERSDGGVAVT